MDMSAMPHARRIREEAPDAHLSRAIAMARVICILGIVYVHAWTGRNGHDLQMLDHTSQGMLRWALIELMGRSSVPLLSMISGWLVAPSIARRDARHFLAGKLRTVFVPMVLWNALAIVLVSGAALAGWIYAPQPVSVWWVVNELLCLITPDDINVQIPFLRDLFLCMLAVPLLVRRSDRALLGVAGFALVWSLAPVWVPVLLRPSILLFFVAGMVARRHGLAAWMGSRPLVLVALPYVAMAAVRIWLEESGAGGGPGDQVFLSGIDLVMRGATAIFFWALAWRLAESPIAPLLRRVEPYMFLAFCAHLIMIWLAGPLIGRISGPIGSPLYPLFLLVQPLLVLGGSLALGRGLLRVAPAGAYLLSGGRLGGQKPA